MCWWYSSPSTTNMTLGGQRPWGEMVWHWTAARMGNRVHTSSWQLIRELWRVSPDFLPEDPASPCSLKVKSVIFFVMSKANEEQALLLVFRDTTWTLALLTMAVTNKGSMKVSGQMTTMPSVDPNVAQWYALRTGLGPAINESNRQAPSGVECTLVGDWSNVTEAGLQTLLGRLWYMVIEQTIYLNCCVNREYILATKSVPMRRSSSLPWTKQMAMIDTPEEYQGAKSMLLAELWSWLYCSSKMKMCNWS